MIFLINKSIALNAMNAEAAITILWGLFCITSAVLDETDFALISKGRSELAWTNQHNLIPLLQSLIKKWTHDLSWSQMLILFPSRPCGMWMWSLALLQPFNYHKGSYPRWKLTQREQSQEKNKKWSQSLPGIKPILLWTLSFIIWRDVFPFLFKLFWGKFSITCN